MMHSAETFVAAVRHMPFVALEIDDAQRSAGIRAYQQLVARIDLGDGRVTVIAPPDVIPTLQGLFPSSRAAANGIVFDLASDAARSEALAAIRRQARVERFVGQFRHASP